MNGNNIFLDTNIILYLLSGDQTVADLLHNKNIFISFITELELLGYKDISTEEVIQIERLLADSSVIDINSEIKKIVIGLRKSYKINLPDAIIAASSYYLNLPFITADKELSKLTELDILLYEK
ncbi:type II toxin-antitoxin system VapC family toxin [Rubrolithibacter danxiaensis]|uniref:type II toxin-antitoxin system VapC family toxin n=1 Tax=Rubrolithibacter danxiaensis TaxID=3390805 RepID=UPI003BF7C05F